MVPLWAAARGGPSCSRRAQPGRAVFCALSLALAAMVTGCVEMETRLRVFADGTAESRVSVSMPQFLMADLEEDENWAANMALYCDSFRQISPTLTATGTRTDDGSRSVCTHTVRSQDIEADEAAFIAALVDHEFVLERSPDGWIASLLASTVDNCDPDIEALLGDSSFRMVVNGEILKVSGYTQTAPDAVELTLPLFDAACGARHAGHVVFRGSGTPIDEETRARALEFLDAMIEETRLDLLRNRSEVYCLVNHARANCVVDESGQALIRLEHHDGWRYRDGRVVPQEDWPDV